MVSARHGKQTIPQGIHGIVAYEYADEASRLAATGFVAEDLYKLSVQLDNDSLWILTDISPIIWGSLNFSTPGATNGDLLYFDGSNWITLPLGADGYVLVANTALTHPVWTPPTGGSGGSNNFGLAAGTQTVTSGTVVFSNSNGLAFGLNGSTITGSYTVPSTAGLISAINVSAGTTSNNLSAITFSNANGLSFGLDGSTITGSYTVPTVPPQTNQTVGLYGLGNTTQNSSTTLDARSLSFNGLGIVTVGYSNGSIQLSATQSNQTANVVVPSAGTQTATSGTVVFSNSNGISFGMSGSSRITASYTVPSTAGLISAINVSAGTTSNNLSAFTFSNSNGLAFGLDGSTITGSYTVPTQTAQTQNVVVPSAGTQTATSGTVVYSNSNNITFGMSGSSRVTASYNFNVSAGTTSNNLNAITFSNSNGISFGLNGSTITASYTLPTQTNQTVGLYGLGNTTQNSSTTLDARSLSFNGLGGNTVGYSNGSIQISGVTTAGLISVINVSAGTTSNNLSAITFSNSNGMSFGLNGSTITGSYTVPTQSAQTAGLYALGNTTQNSSTTLDVRSLSFNGLGAATLGYSNGSIQVSVPVQTAQTQSNIQAIYDGAASITTGTIRFSNSNGVTFGINGQTITASHNGITSQSNQVLSLFAVSNTTQSSSGTIDARSLSVHGAGIASVGVSNGSLIISVGAAGASINFSAGTTSNNLNAITFSNANGISFGLNASTITASVAAQTNQTVGLYALGNTTQNSSTTLDARSLSFNGLGIITAGYSNGSIQLSATQSNQTANVVVPSAGTQTATSGTVVFSNSNGISFGMSGSSRITASYTVPSTAGLISAINISGGTTSNNLSALTFDNANNVSFGLDGSTLTASASFNQTVQTQNVVVPSAGTQTATSGTVVFSNSNGISFGMSGSSRITASYTVPSTAGLISAINISAGTTSNNLSALTFSNSNGLAFGLDGSTVTGSYTVPSIAGLISAINVSAGTTSNNLSALTFSNSNGMSFGLNGSTITGSYTVPTVPPQTNQTVGLYGLGNTTQNSSTTLDARSLSFNGLGMVTVGYSNGSIQLSATQSNQTANVVVPSAGTQTATSGTVVFSNSNGISFGMSGSSRITASYTVPSTAGLISAINVSAGTTSNNLSAITFSNANNVTFGIDGSTVTASASFVAQTNQTVGLYALGNTTQNSSTILDARSLSFNGLGGATIGYSNGSIQISAPTTANLISRINVSAGTTSNNLSALTFNNANGISFGLDASTITASYTVPTQTNQTVGLYGLGNTTQNSSTTLDARSLSFNGVGAATVGYSNGSIQLSVPVQTVQTQSNIQGIYDGANSITTGTIRFSNSNGVSFGINGQTITASHNGITSQTAQTVGLYALGNTTQNSSTTLDARSLSFNGLGDITVGYSNGSIQVSGSQTVQTSNIVVPSAGTQTATSGTVVFSNSNGISFGMSGSSRITASYTVPSTAGLLSAINLSAGTTSNNLSAFVFSNSNNVSFGLNGSTVTATITVPAQTNQTIGLYALGNTTQNSSSTLDARTLSFNGLGGNTVGYSNGSIQISGVTTNNLISGINVSAGTTSNNLSAITFSNANGITFGLNGSTITASVQAGAAAGIGAVDAGTQTQTSGTLVFANSNGVTFGMSGSSQITASVAGGGGSGNYYAVGNTTQNSSTTLSNTVSFNALGAMTMGYSNGSIQVSAPATSSLVGVGGIILSTNNSTVSIGLVSANFHEPNPINQINSSTFAAGLNSLYFQPFRVDLPMGGGRINIINSHTGSLNGTNGASYHSASTGIRRQTFGYTKTLALYTQGIGTNSTRLESLWSNTWTMAVVQSVSVSTAAAVIRVTNAGTLSYIASVGTDGGYTTTTLAASGSVSTTFTTIASASLSSILSSMANMISGIVVVPIGFNTTINPGNYWLMQAHSLSSSTSGTTAQFYGFSGMYMISGLNTHPRLFGATTINNSSQLIPGQGVFSTTSAAVPSTVAFTNILTTQSNQIYYFNILNSNA